ncbi:jg10233 [Pararge aegeria aegeria]|uniref:Jg10233 protein n=1 Tax=Pararge aegeria aegeria TaxID=348720 RepID=A0A8S4S9Y4_9NEOP|nr:jg10233 [Pararge aegeria aegeria]
MKSKDMPMKYKQKVFDMCILPILTYGSQTWALTQKLEQKLAICQRSMERSMLHVKRLDKIRNESLRKETNITDVKVKIRKLKWKWAGHVCRQKQDRWAKRVTEWYPREGKRSRGRQRIRWSDDFVKMMGATWQRLARDRDAWKEMEEAFVQRAY